MASTAAAIDAAGSYQAIADYHAAEGLSAWQDLYDHYYALCDGQPGAPADPANIGDLITFAWVEGLAP